MGLGWAGRRRRHVDPAVQAERFKDDPNPKWKNCPSPKKVFSERPNGKIHCFLSTCQLVCEQPGFVIDGKEKIKCKGGKKKKGGLWEWKGQLGTCLATCKTLTAPNGMQSRCKTSKKVWRETFGKRSTVCHIQKSIERASVETVIAILYDLKQLNT